MFSQLTQTKLVKPRKYSCCACVQDGEITTHRWGFLMLHHSSRKTSESRQDSLSYFRSSATENLARGKHRLELSLSAFMSYRMKWGLGRYQPPYSHEICNHVARYKSIKFKENYNFLQFLSLISHWPRDIKLLTSKWKWMLLYSRPTNILLTFQGNMFFSIFFFILITWTIFIAINMWMTKTWYA